MVKRKKPTIKELASLVAQNRQGLEVIYKNMEELKFYTSSLDKIFDWYIEFKDDAEKFKEFIEKKKIPGENNDSDGAKDSISDRKQEVSKEKSSNKSSEKTK